MIRWERKRRSILSQHSRRLRIERASTTRLHTLRSLLRFESYLAQAVQVKREVLGTLISKPPPQYTNITFCSLFISLLYIIIKKYLYYHCWFEKRWAKLNQSNSLRVIPLTRQIPFWWRSSIGMHAVSLIGCCSRAKIHHLATTNEKQDMIHCRATSSTRTNRSEYAKKEDFPTGQVRESGDKARTKSLLSLAVLSLAKLTTCQAFSGAASSNVHGTILLHLWMHHSLLPLWRLDGCYRGRTTI